MSGISTRLPLVGFPPGHANCLLFPPAEPETCSALLDLCILIDSSGSIRDNNPSDGSYDNWELMLQFVSQVVGRFDVGLDKTRIAALVFSEDVRLEFGLDTFDSASDMMNAVKAINYIGMTTNTPAALEAVKSQCFGGAGDRPDARNLLLTITDGIPFPPDRFDPAVAMAQDLRDNGISTLAVGITDQIDEAFLKELSGQRGTQSGSQVKDFDYYTAPDFQSLTPLLNQIATGSCAPG